MTIELRKGDRPKRCGALGCSEVIPRHLLMCGKHWNLVPADIQQQVYSTHREMSNGFSVRPWLLASSRAQLAVGEAEQLEAAILDGMREVVQKLEAVVNR